MTVQAVLTCILFATLRTDNVSVLVLEVNVLDVLLQGPLMKIWRGNTSSLKCLLSSYESNSSLTFLTVRALFPSFLSVCSHVPINIDFLSESFPTYCAFKWLLPCMYSDMLF